MEKIKLIEIDTVTMKGKPLKVPNVKATILSDGTKAVYLMDVVEAEIMMYETRLQEFRDFLNAKVNVFSLNGSKSVGPLASVLREFDKKFPSFVDDSTEIKKP